MANGYKQMDSLKMQNLDMEQFYSVTNTSKLKSLSGKCVEMGIIMLVLRQIRKAKYEWWLMLYSVMLDKA